MKKLFISFFALILFTGIHGMSSSNVQRLQKKVERIEKSIDHFTQKSERLQHEIEFFRVKNQELRSKCGLLGQ